jgi:glucose 1-dehydrogenase
MPKVRERYELCEDLAQMLVDQAETARFKSGGDERETLARMELALSDGGSALERAELSWVITRLAELLGWERPGSAQGWRPPRTRAIALETRLDVATQAREPLMDAPTQLRFQGKVALVTGAAQGIGLAIAERLAREGMQIALNVRHEDDRSRAAQQQVAAAGARCEVFPADVADAAQGRRMLADVVQRMGRLDVLVNNAGIERKAGVLDIREEDYDAVLATNLKGPLFLSQAFAAHARDAGHGGSIINISSVHEELPFPHFAPYCASKGGLKMVTRTLALELAPLAITVNNVAPGATRTPINQALLADKPMLTALLAQIPAGRLGEPADVAGAVAFLASDDARYITGTTLVVDGGLLWNYSEQ